MDAAPINTDTTQESTPESVLRLPKRGQDSINLSTHAFFQIFKSLDPHAIVTPETTNTYPAGHVLFKQDDPSDGAYLVLEGAVVATVADPLTGNPIEIATFKAGSFFGEYGTLDKGRRSATATAILNSRMAFVPGETLRNLLSDQRPRDEMLSFVKNAINAVAVANDSFVQQAAQAGIGLAVTQLAHNIKNPLTIFTIAPDMLRDKNENCEAGRLADQITSRGRRIGGLIDGLLALSRDPMVAQQHTLADALKDVVATPSNAHTNAEARSLIANNTFFTVFSREDPRTLHDSGELISFRKGDRVFLEGERSSDVYLHLQGGPVQIIRAGRSGKPIKVAQIAAGDFFGHYGLFRGGMRIAMAQTTTDATMLKINATEFQRVIQCVGSTDLITLMRHIIKDARRGNLHFAHQNRLVEIVEQTRSFAAGVMPIIEEIEGLLQELHDLDGLRDPSSLVDKMGRELKRIHAVVYDLAVCSSGDPRPQLTEMNARDIFSELNTTFSDTFTKLGWRWNVTSVSKNVSWDKEQILSVLENLVKNAQEAIEAQASPNADVWVMAEDLGDSVLINVGDNGPGLPDVIKNHPFEMFLTQCKVRGTGLGLAICKTIIEAHGGTIRFDDNPVGQGTLFTIELPCHPSVPESTPDEETPEKA